MSEGSGYIYNPWHGRLRWPQDHAEGGGPPAEPSQADRSEVSMQKRREGRGGAPDHADRRGEGYPIMPTGDRGEDLLQYGEHYGVARASEDGRSAAC